MFKKIINLIKENLKLVIIFVIFLILSIYKLPYYIETPGGTIDTSKRYKIDNHIKTKGSFNLAYVGEIKATIPFLIYSKINKDWKVLPKEQILENETIDEIEFRNNLMLEEANNNAIKLAYKKANKKYNVLKNELYVTYVDEIAKTNLKTKDKIIRIDSNKVKTKKDFFNYIKKKKVGDKVIIEVINDHKTYERTATIIKYKNRKIIGIIVSEKQKLETEPNIKIKFKNSESGGSGGLMMTLSIYNSLIKEDLTHGLKIAGTGTIDEDGTVGEIDGVRYKIIGAVKKKADLFFVPDGKNYEEALKVKKERKYKIKIIKVKTLEDAIKYLKKND